MGIRYDRDSGRTTNGPMFFFSILKDETFQEEIRSAFLSGLSFYAYRQPFDKMFCYGASEGYIEGLGEPGFVISFFSPEKPYITIPYHSTKTNRNTTYKPFCFTPPSASTSFEDYSTEVNHIIDALKKGEGSKVVAARVIVENTAMDIAEKFYNLCQEFPDAYIFCFSTPATGCWIGASPELLLENTSGNLHTMALAGTRPIGLKEVWDEKNKEEQQIVTDYIAQIFRRHNLQPVIGETYTKTAGSIEHICTEIKGFSTEKYAPMNEGWLENLLRDLSPTPALCGQPKDFALKEISQLEKFDRGCYGGFCGPFRSLQDFHFNVVLRCAFIQQHRYCIYVGGGITSQSSVLTEWNETRLKASNTFGISD